MIYSDCFTLHIPLVCESVCVLVVDMWCLCVCVQREVKQDETDSQGSTKEATALMRGVTQD